MLFLLNERHSSVIPAKSGNPVSWVWRFRVTPGMTSCKGLASLIETAPKASPFLTSSQVVKTCLVPGLFLRLPTPAPLWPFSSRRKRKNKTTKSKKILRHSQVYLYHIDCVVVKLFLYRFGGFSTYYGALVSKTGRKSRQINVCY